MYDDSTWHMSEWEQFSSICIAVLIVFCIGLGIWAIVRDIVADDTLDEVEDELIELAEDLYENRDQHTEPLLGERWST